ncbi:hypothetical protein G6F56_014511 [Rhizopus delemar]|nr:hypothetical protein G6F56_014511 [Rhizopus delemar]
MTVARSAMSGRIIAHPITRKATQQHAERGEVSEPQGNLVSILNEAAGRQREIIGPFARPLTKRTADDRLVEP